MAVKTITIDMEAYTRLKQTKRANESFSQTIKRLAPKPFDFDAFLKRLKSVGPDEEYTRIMDEVVAQRGQHDRKRRKHGLS